VASSAWLLVSATAVGLGARRIRAAEFASSRRNAHRFAVTADVTVDGHDTQVVDASVGGVLVRLPAHVGAGAGLVELGLPEAAAVKLSPVRTKPAADDEGRLVSLRVQPGDWAAMRVLSLWLFHTPQGAVRHLRPGVPVAASTAPASSPSVRHNRAASARVRTNPVVLHA
jgi:cellulose synthase (UDP-forming)